MMLGALSNNDRAYPTTFKGKRKKQNLDSVVGDGKYRLPHAPRIDQNSAPNNHK